MYTGPVIESCTGPVIESISSPIRNLRLDTAPEARLNGFYIPSLDGIRALAFCLVFAAHAWELTLGMFGVTDFFFLSGFLITTLMRREHELSGSISLRNFYIRRSLRIFPPLYLTTGFILVLVVTTCFERLEWTPAHSLLHRPLLPIIGSPFMTSGIWVSVHSGLSLLRSTFTVCFHSYFSLMNRLGLSYKNQSLGIKWAVPDLSYLATAIGISLFWR